MVLVMLVASLGFLSWALVAGSRWVVLVSFLLLALAYIVALGSQRRPM